MDNVFYWGNLILWYSISGYVLFKFMFKLFKKKYTMSIYVLSYFMFVSFAIIVNQLRIPLLKSFYGLLATCLVGICLFDAPMKRKIVGASLLFYLYMFIMDTISVLAFSVLSGRTMEIIMGNSAALFFSGLASQVMLLCFYRPLIVIMKKHEFGKIATQQNIFLIILALFEILIIDYISIIIDTSITSVVLTILSVGFLGLDIYLIYLFEAISQKYTLENEMKLRDQQLSMQNNYYHNIEAQYDHSRRLIHDMKNHMQTLEELYISGSGIEAKYYAQTILESMDALSGRFKCKNRILTIIVNDKILKCDELRIELNIEVEDIDFNFIDPFDMTTIFSNLLDNAIEACTKIPIERRMIVLRVFKFNQFVTISIRNQYNGELAWDKDTLVSTKGGKHMGLGLKNVESAVEKYDGTIQRKSNDEFFEVKILLSPSA
ncbi:ATP-binding protein [Eubacterium sp. 1001713B170207_170306_E7]|uniref:sensor histidine kinase n=1 Tax=Eubacterium sp. 1001713B170207_170306_E7 TaxID=2787097 RepID=UPI00189900BD|nr:ATP-binding protein [Eubacterium sp. 1001713B170207_170306_E7]